MDHIKRACNFFLHFFFSSNEPQTSISRSCSQPDLCYLKEASENNPSYNDKCTINSYLKNKKMSDESLEHKIPLHLKLQSLRPAIVIDEEEHLIYSDGNILADKYQIIQTIGEGTFGKVVSAKNLNNQGQIVAVKIMKKNKNYQATARLEINVLEKLNKKDPEGKNLCVRMIENFEYKGYICICFELLGLSVFEFLKQNGYRPFTIDQIRHISYQLCYAVRFLHCNKLTHTDLKPENIIFVNSEHDKCLNQKKGTEIRLIDFGNATFDDDDHSSIVSTKHYRAPEVILKLGWAQPCDIWSIGCIIFELYFGHMLFPTIHSYQHLAIMHQILGPIPKQMVRRSKTKYFHRGKLNWDDSNHDSQFIKKNCKPLNKYMKSQDEDHQLLFDLISKMLTYLPSQRITVEKALDHQFFHKLPSHQRLHDIEK